MTLEETTSTGGEQSFAALLTDSNATTAPSNEPAVDSEPTSSEGGESAQEPAPEQSTPPERDVELERLRRVIAGDPNLSSRYEQEIYREYGQPYQPPQPVQQQAQAQPQQTQTEPQLPFDEATFDPTNVQHMAALMNYQLSQQLKPFGDYIQQDQEREQRYQKEQADRLMMEREVAVHETLDQHVPGYKDVLLSQNPTPEQVALYNTAQALFTQTVRQGYPEGLWLNEKVHKEVAARIAPQLKQVAGRLGLLKEAAKAAESKGFHVETSSTVPPAQAGGKRNLFAAAAEKGSLAGMLKHINN